MADKKMKVAFSALDPFIEINIPKPTQKEVSGKRYIPYGSRNEYPAYMLDCYKNCSTLKAIIDGNANFVLGDAILFDGTPMDEYRKEQLRELVRDYYIFGYGFLQILSNPFGQIEREVRLPAEFVRTDKDHQAFWFSEKWYKVGAQKALIYPVYGKDTTNGVLMFGKGRDVYPSTLWSASIASVETERSIDKFHINELENNFLSSAIVSMCNGVPDDKAKEEIEKDMREKFSGNQNAGRIMILFSDSVQNRAIVDRLGTDNFDTRYKELAKRCREQIFIAFKAQPILFGLTSETNTGFSTQEFSDLFRLYNKVMISPIQDMLKDMYRRIYGRDMLTIQPFTL